MERCVGSSVRSRAANSVDQAAAAVPEATRDWRCSNVTSIIASSFAACSSATVLSAGGTCHHRRDVYSCAPECLSSRLLAAGLSCAVVLMLSIRFQAKVDPSHSCRGCVEPGEDPATPTRYTARASRILNMTCHFSYAKTSHCRRWFRHRIRYQSELQ